MKRIRLAYVVIPIFLSFGCSNNNNNPSPDAHDAKLDTTGDHPTDTTQNEVSQDLPSEQTPDANSDVPKDMAPDTTPDAPKMDGGQDVADATTQRLVHTVLVIDQAPDGGADAGADAGPTIDPNLVNPWGLAFNPTGPLWVANNGTGTSTIYTPQGMPNALVVTIPTAAGGTPPSAPTGLVFNVTGAFMADKFIFSSEDGVISGWQAPATTADVRADLSTSHAIYKGLALGLRNNVARLYATDFHNGKVDVFDQNYAKITTTGGFVDATLPAGFAPFGIHAEGAAIFVTFAKQNAIAKDDVKGAGNGYVDAFDFDGVLTRRLISGGALNSPWAIVLAPADFGDLGHDMLVGNFGDGHINAYDPSSGAFLGAVLDSPGVPLSIEGLWSLTFGNDTAGAAHNQLFFTAGPGDEMHGVLGRLDFVP
jgi:uncharacterized protein (TIGR03118 family)